jgi:hypothetical protein
MSLRLPAGPPARPPGGCIGPHFKNMPVAWRIFIRRCFWCGMCSDNYRGGSPFAMKSGAPRHVAQSRPRNCRTARGDARTQPPHASRESPIAALSSRTFFWIALRPATAGRINFEWPGPRSRPARLGHRWSRAACPDRAWDTLAATVWPRRGCALRLRVWENHKGGNDAQAPE